MAHGTLGLPARAAVDPNDPNVVVRRITVPIQGSFSYRDDFGDPRGSGVHEGNDLMVAKGRPLLAVVDATVRRIYVDNGTASQGNMLVLRDSEGWEYWYIHINNDTPGTDDGLNPLEHAFAAGITVGAKVTAGQVVAYAGDSGNAEATGAHLHFEIHQPGGTPVDPYPSLRLAQGLRFGNRCAFDTNPTPFPAMSSAPGYWLLGGDGGVFSFGEAAFHGSTGGIKLNRPAVAMAATGDGEGYWFAATDGGIFAFGDAGFFGSTGAMTLNQPIVGMAATPSGDGYWLIARDGGIFAFGDAGFLGSTGAGPLPSPVIDLAVTPTGKGYWLLAEDGGVYAFGDATYRGSPAGTGFCDRPAARRIAASATGKGYWVAAADGSVLAFGDAYDHGSPKAAGVTPNAALLDLVPVPVPPPSPTTTTTTTTTKPSPSSTTTTTRRRR
ncbi:MAG TPA: M23 family metallopeptidase [Acidimicrobiia bacterium]